MAGFRINGITYVQENGKTYKIMNGKKEQIPQSVFDAQKKKFDSLPKAKVHYVEDSKSGWYYLKYPNGKIIYKDNKGNTVQKDEFMKHEGAFMSEDGSIKPYNWKTKLSAGLNGVGNFFADMVTSEQPVPKKDKNGNIIKDKHGNPIYEKNPDGTPKTSRQFDLGRTVTTVAVGAAIAAVCVLAAPVAAALGASAATAAAIGTTVQVGIGAAFVASGGKKMYDAEMENRRDDITNEQKIKNWENKGAGGVEAFMGAFMMKGGAKSYGKSKSIAADVAKNVEVKNKASFAQDGKLGKMTDLKNRWSAAKEGAKAYRKAKPNQEQKTETTEKLSDSRPKNADDALEVGMYKNAIKRSNDKGQLKTELKKNKNLTEEETTAIKDRLNELETLEKEVKDIEKTLADEKSSLEGVQEKINKLSDPQAKARLQARLEVRQLDMGDKGAVDAYFIGKTYNAVALDELAAVVKKTNKMKPEDKASLLRDIYKRQHEAEPEVYPDIEAEITAREQKAAKKQSGTDSPKSSADNKPKSSMGWFGKTMRWFRTEVKEVKNSDGTLSHKDYIDKKTGQVYKRDYGTTGYYEYEYDVDGNRTLSVSRDAKGGYEGHTEFRKSEDGKIKYTIRRDANDNITSINQEGGYLNIELFYDNLNGKLTVMNGKEVKYNPDGTAYYEYDLIDTDGTVQIQKAVIEQKYLDLPSKFKDVPNIDNSVGMWSSVAAYSKGLLDKFAKKETNGAGTSKPQSSMGWYGKTMRWFRTERKNVYDNDGILNHIEYIDKKTGKVYKKDYGELGTYEYEYDAEGNKILDISRDAKGRLEEYTETKIGEDGVRYDIIRDANDNITEITDISGNYYYDSNGKLIRYGDANISYDTNGQAYAETHWTNQDGTIKVIKTPIEQKYLDLPSKFKDAPVIDKGNGTSMFGTITAKLKGVVEKFNKKEKLTKKELAPNANGNIAVEYRNSEGKLVKTEWYNKDGKYRTNYFDENGNHVKTDWGLGQVDKYYYDKNGKHVRSEGTVWWLRSKKFDHLYEDAKDPNKVTRTIVHNKNNRVLSVKDNTGSVQVEYFYDKKGNLTKIVQDKGDNAATVEVKFKNGDAYNAKNGSPIANSYVERAKQCWEDANNYKPEIAEPKSGDVDVKPKKESDKKIVAVGVSQAGTLGGAVAADNKTVSYEMAEAISQAQAEEALEEDGYEYTEDMTTEDEVPTQESVEEGNPTAGTEDPDGTTDETGDTTSDSDDASSDTSDSSPAPTTGSDETTDKTGDTTSDSDDASSDTSDSSPAPTTGSDETTDKTGDTTSDSDDTLSDTSDSSPAPTTGSDGTTDKTGDVSDASSAQRTRTSDDANASRNKDNNSASRTNRGNVSDKTVNVSTEKSKAVVQEDDITDDESKDNVRELSPQKKFSITHKVQEAKTEDEIADALRLLRKTGVFKGRKNLRRLLKNKRRYLRALESNNTKKMEKSQKRIDKYKEKVENFQTSADNNFEDKYEKKHKGDSIF